MGELLPNGEFLERLRPGDVDWVRFNAEHLVRYCTAARHARGKRVLDAGTGYGYGAALLKCSGAVEVTAVDIDPQVVSEARQRYGRLDVDYIVDDCHVFKNVRGPFDVICNFENIEHLAHPDRFVARAAQLLAPGGMLLCSSPALERFGHAPDKPDNPYHVQEWTRSGFETMLRESFGGVDVDAQVRTHAYVQRAGVVDALWTYINRFQRNPLMRIGDKLMRLLRGGEWSYPPLEGLSIPTMEDFPIVPGELAEAFGVPFCHFAICREPLVAAKDLRADERDKAHA